MYANNCPYYFNISCILTGREMNIQVATSELPLTSSIRGGPRLSGGGANYTQRPQTRFRGNRTGPIRGNLCDQLIMKYRMLYFLLNRCFVL